MPLCARLLLLGLLTAASAHDWFRTVPANTAVVLPCHDPLLFPFSLLNDSAALPEEVAAVKWILPSGAELDPKKPPTGVATRGVGLELAVQASADNQGVYYCAAHFNASQWFFVRRGVNPRGPLVSDPIAVYRQSLINGFASAGAFLLLAGLLALIYTFRWESRVGVSHDDYVVKSEESTCL